MSPATDPHAGPAVLVATELDSADEFQANEDRYPPQDSAATEHLIRLAAEGPLRSCHLIVTFARAERAKQVLKSSLSSFRHRAALAMSEAESHQFIGTRAASRLAGSSPLGAVLHDAQTNREVPFWPFQRPTHEELEKLIHRQLQRRTTT